MQDQARQRRSSAHDHSGQSRLPALQSAVLEVGRQGKVQGRARASKKDDLLTYSVPVPASRIRQARTTMEDTRTAGFGDDGAIERLMASMMMGMSMDVAGAGTASGRVVSAASGRVGSACDSASSSGNSGSSSSSSPRARGLAGAQARARAAGTAQGTVIDISTDQGTVIDISTDDDTEAPDVFADELSILASGGPGAVREISLQAAVNDLGRGKCVAGYTWQ